MAATRAAGANYHLAKPIRPDALIAILAEILGGAGARDEAVTEIGQRLQAAAAAAKTP